MRLLVLVALFFLPISSMAADAVPLEVVCQVRANYIPDEKRGAEYQPGVDVNGNLVAPADLNQSVNVDVKAIDIPIQFEILDEFDVDVPEGVDLDFDAANIRIYQDGRVEFNGQDLTQEFVTLCSRSESTATVAPSAEEKRRIEVESLEAPKAAAGQGAADVLNSAPDTEIQGEYLPPEQELDTTTQSEAGRE